MNKKFLVPFLLACVGLSACGNSLVDIDYPSHEEHEISLNATSLSLAIGEEAALMIDVEEGETVKWINTDAAVVSLTYEGSSAIITGKTKGNARIYAFVGNARAYCDVVVAGGSGDSPVVVSSLSLSEYNKVVDKGESFSLTATYHATGGAPNLSWSSTNEDVAIVSKQNATTALVTTYQAGIARIVVESGGKKAECVLTVEDTAEETLSVRLNTNRVELDVGATVELKATTKPAETTVTWASNNTSVATVDNGTISAVATGTAKVTATVSDGEQQRTAECDVVVKSTGGDTDYENQIASWSKPGHLYMHYLRTSDTNYDKWAVWMWQNYPNDLAGSLWGANTSYNLKGITPQTTGWMTNAECGGSGNDAYLDDYGRVVDIDLTADVKDGKTGSPAPLVTDWTNIAKNALGFLIVDQSKMTGEDMWVSDGGAESYIKKLGKLMPDGADSYLHVYCVEGNVSQFTTSSGKQIFVNPTVTDTTGQYRSKNDITNLKYDAFTNGVSTSETFLEDRPGIGYQIFVPSFADGDGDGFGDLRGIINKLDYLEDLGAKVLWLTPIQESNSYHGYDVTDYYKIDPKFGTMEDYQELIYKAHQKGMKVLMDMVINHTSKSNVLFQKSQRAETEVINGKTINYRDMYLWKYEGDKILEWDQKPSSIKDEKGNPKPYGVDNPANFIKVNVETSSDWYRDGTSNYYYYGKFGSGMAELNYSSQATRDYMTDMCKYWLSFGLDGFRLDAIKHIYLLAELDTAYNYAGDYITYDVGMRTYYNTEMMKEVTVPNDYTYDRDLNVIFWKQFAGVLKSAYPNCFLVGENFDGWNERIAPFYEAIDSQFDFSTYYHLHESTANGIVAMGGDIIATLGYNKSYRSNHINGAFTSNHDVARMMNHCASTDQKSHHAEITTSNKELALKNARWDAAITLLTPGVSWIYYGDEIGIGGNTADKVPDKNGNIYDDHGNNVDRWYRQPMKWGSTKGKDMVVDYTFGGVEVLWDNYSQTIATVPEQQADPNSLYNLFKALCHAKNDPRYPTYGYLTNQWAEGSNMNVLCMQISDGTRTVNAFINATDSAVPISPLNQGEFIGGSVGASATTIPANGFCVVKK